MMMRLPIRAEPTSVKVPSIKVEQPFFASRRAHGLALVEYQPDGTGLELLSELAARAPLR